MKWVTRERVRVDRVACAWLIRKFVDQDAEFLFVPEEQVHDVAMREDAVPFDVPGAELGHHGKQCSFEAIIWRYNLAPSYPALILLSRIVNGADTDNTLYEQPESPGLYAIAEGFRNMGYANDHEILKREFIVYDALYAYCRKRQKSQ